MPLFVFVKSRRPILLDSQLVGSTSADCKHRLKVQLLQGDIGEDIANGDVDAVREYRAMSRLSWPPASDSIRFRPVEMEAAMEGYHIKAMHEETFYP